METTQNNTANKLKVGQVFTKDFNYTQERVNEFAISSGDTNPLHSDPAYAATTVFKKPIMHGMIGVGVISSIIGTQIKGSIYLGQNLAFKKPMFVGTTYEVVVTILEINKEKHIVKLKTDILNKETREACVLGDAVIYNKESF